VNWVADTGGAYSIPLYSPLIHLRAVIAALEALRHPKITWMMASPQLLGVLQLGHCLGYCGDVEEIGEVGVAR
jgi:hypothetical protein